MKYLKLFDKFNIFENVDIKSHNYSELINVDEMSKEYDISSEEVKKCIDELQKEREESNEILKKEKGAGFVEMNSKGAQDSLLQLLVNKNILVRVKGLDSTILKNKGVKPGPDFGKLMKEFSDRIMDKKFMTPENYEKEIDLFFKEKGY